MLQRAILWLRHGHDVEARKELIRLQGRALVHPNVELAAWLHLAEGLAAYFSTFGSGARDRVRRARVMAQAGGLGALQNLAEAWLAQMDLVGRDLEGFMRHTTSALQLLGRDDHVAGYRITTAVASAWSLAGREKVALTWWARARSHAVANEDNADIEALIYQTQMRALQIRHAAFAGDVRADPAELLGVD
ncbi:MAG TPA: hypothetical protein VIN58_18750 [Roseateles sp.]